MFWTVGQTKKNIGFTLGPGKLSWNFFHYFLLFQNYTIPNGSSSVVMYFIQASLSGIKGEILSMSPVALFFENKPEPNYRYQISSGRVKLKQRAIWKGREKVLIISPFSTFHTSTLAARGPKGHLQWPLIAISPSNDAFSWVTGKLRLGSQLGPMLKESNCPFKTSPYAFLWD